MDVGGWTDSMHRLDLRRCIEPFFFFWIRGTSKASVPKPAPISLHINAGLYGAG